MSTTKTPRGARMSAPLEIFSSRAAAAAFSAEKLRYAVEIVKEAQIALDDAAIDIDLGYTRLTLEGVAIMLEGYAEAQPKEVMPA